VSGWTGRSLKVQFCTVAFIILVGATADAQVFIGSPDAPRKGSWEAGGGVVWTGGYDLESLDALLTGNEGNAGGPFTLFATEARLRPAIGAQARIGFYVSPALAFEAGVQYSRPVFEASISDDAEDAEDLTAEETLSRYVIDGSLVYHMRQLSFSRGRGVPFISAGAGYLRELHEGEEVVETGTTYHVGAGVKFWMTSGKRRYGLRGDAGVTVRDGGFDFEDKRRLLPTAGASLIVLF
jgi:hypothetical protein